MGRVIHQVWVFCDFSVDIDQGLNKGVDSFLCFGLSGLDHERLMNNQREVHGWGVEAVIQQSLGYFQTTGAALHL